MAYNYLDPGLRSYLLGEIVGPENKDRKAEHLKRAEVYGDRQRQYVLKMLENEFSKKTVSQMRTCTSINLTKRIINELASIYKREPEREYKEATPEQIDHLNNLYEHAQADVRLKRANKKFKLHDQCCIQVLPKDGELKLRVLAPHQFDVVPSMDDPERAECYIISVGDKWYSQQNVEGTADIQGQEVGGKNQQQTDNVNQMIADKEDWKAKEHRFIWWTEQLHFVTDGNGNMIGEPEVNPIQMLPFVDVANEKDFEYWIRKNSNAVEFNLDFSVVLSDTCNTNRLQGYAQAVITAENMPENMTVGPNNVLFLAMNPDRPESKPVFEFVSPNPDLAASLNLQDRLLSYFLTANGVDPKAVTGTAEGQSFSSGFERMLAMIDRFEASQDDFDLFENVEQKIFKLMVAWNNTLQGTNFFTPQLKGPNIPETVYMEVEFAGPEKIQSTEEKESSIIRRLEAGLISRAEAIAEDRDIELDEAQALIPTIDSEMLPAVTPEVESDIMQDEEKDAQS